MNIDFTNLHTSAQVFWFRVKDLYPRLQFTTYADAISPESMAQHLHRSRKLEDLIDIVYTVLDSSDTHSGFGQRDEEDILDAIACYMKNVYGENEEVPSWVKDCIHLGSYMPIVDNIRRIIARTCEDDMSTNTYLDELTESFRWFGND